MIQGLMKGVEEMLQQRPDMTPVSAEQGPRQARPGAELRLGKAEGRDPGPWLTQKSDPRHLNITQCYKWWALSENLTFRIIISV